MYQAAAVVGVHLNKMPASVLLLMIFTEGILSVWDLILPGNNPMRVTIM
jgi:hypothetical protein